MMVFLLTRLSSIMPIRIRSSFFYYIYKITFKIFLHKMKSFRKVVFNNYQRFVRKSNTKMINRFYPKYIKNRNIQSSDFLTLVSASDKEVKKIHINYQGKELFDKYSDEKKGLIIAIPHISSYTSIFIILTKFLKIKANIMALSYEASSLFEDDMLEDWTSSFLDKVNIIPVSNFSLVKAYDCLKNGEILIILPELPTTSFSDKDSYPKFMFDMEDIPKYPLGNHQVDFLNETIYATEGIVQLGMRTEAPVLFTVMRKSGALDYNITFEELQLSKEKKDLHANIQLLYQTLEKEILIKPCEWVFWSHLHKLIYDKFD